MIKSAMIRKRSEKLDILRRKACGLWQMLHTLEEDKHDPHNCLTGQEDLPEKAVMAFKELWRAQTEARFDLFKMKAPEPSEDEDNFWLEVTDELAMHGVLTKKKAIATIKKAVKAGYGNMNPEMDTPKKGDPDWR